MLGFGHEGSLLSISIKRRVFIAAGFLNFSPFFYERLKMLELGSHSRQTSENKLIIDFKETLQTGVGASVSCPGLAKSDFLLKFEAKFDLLLKFSLSLTARSRC